MKNFEYQLQLAGLTLEDFAIETAISDIGVQELSKTSGGMRYMAKMLEKIKEEGITVGDVVQVALCRGHHISMVHGYIHISGYSKRIKYTLPYQELQSVLGQLLIEIDTE